MRMSDLWWRANCRLLAHARISALGWDDLPPRKYRAITWEFMRQQRIAARLWVELFEEGTQNYMGVEYSEITLDELCEEGTTMTSYPIITQVNEIRTDYYDYECGHVWLATFEVVYEDHVRLEISSPFGWEMRTVCVEGLELNSAEDYKKVLESLGYYEYL